jgi:hypothetical protein
MDYEFFINNGYDLPFDVVLFFSINPERPPTELNRHLTIEGDYEAIKKAWAVRSLVSNFKITPAISIFTVMTEDWRGNSAQMFGTPEEFACDDETCVFFKLPPGIRTKISFTLNPIT